MILGVKLEYRPSAVRFYNKTVNRWNSPKIKGQLFDKAKVQDARLDEDYFIILHYGIFGDWLFKRAGLLSGLVMLFFLGLSYWIIIPIGIYNTNKLFQWISFWLMVKGLRKEGYKHKIKKLNDEKTMEAVLYGTT